MEHFRSELVMASRLVFTNAVGFTWPHMYGPLLGWRLSEHHGASIDALGEMQRGSTKARHGVSRAGGKASSRSKSGDGLEEDQLTVAGRKAESHIRQRNPG